MKIPQRVLILACLFAAGCASQPRVAEEVSLPTATTPSQAAVTKPAPTATVEAFSLPDELVWFAPNMGSADYGELFRQGDQWNRAREEVDVFKFYTQNLLPDNCDICGENLLGTFVGVDAFRRLGEWNILTSVEVGAVKEWGCTGQRGYEVVDEVVQNVMKNGGTVHLLDMDEPRLYGETAQCGLSVTQMAENTAYFIDKVHAKYPHILIGDTEPYPHYSIQQLEEWIVELEQQGVELAFFHLDVDVERVRVEGQNVSADLQEISRFCEEHGIPFGVIFTSNWKHAGSDWAYYQSTLQWVQTVYAAIGRPAHVLFQSWQGPAANGLHMVPINLPDQDADIFSHTRLILEGLSILEP